MPTGWTPAAASSTLEEWTHTFSRGQQCSCFRRRNTLCRTRGLSNATFSLFWSRHENRMIFHWDMAIYRFSKWRPSAILGLFYHYTRRASIMTATTYFSIYQLRSRQELISRLGSLGRRTLRPVNMAYYNIKNGIIDNIRDIKRRIMACPRNLGQGRWKWRHSIDHSHHIRLSISPSL